MPIYEYHCDNCDRSFETLVRPGHEEDAQCPSCNGVRISREMSVFASGRGDNGEAGLSDTSSGIMRGGGCCGGSCGCH
jgi:putative FmdB family regulatory protein